MERDAERLLSKKESLCRLAIGGTAVGTQLNAHLDFHELMVKRLSQLTGLEMCISDNLFESMQSMADFSDFSGAMRTLAITLTRIANDIRLLSSGPSTGLDEIRLKPVQPGSSIMPGKVNPVMAEMLNMTMFHVQGDDLAVSLASQAGQLELNVMMPIIAHNLFEMMQISINAIKAFTDKLVRGIEANRKKAEGWLEKNVILVTALNPVIGYSEGAKLAKEAMQRDMTIRELAMERAAEGKLMHRRENRPVTPEEVNETLSDLRCLTECGIVADY